jgi:hypothetical protein
MEMNENIIIYGFFSNVRKAVSYALLYHKDRKMFSVYTRGLCIDLRTGEETEVESDNPHYQYINSENDIVYFSSYTKAKASFDEIVVECIEDKSSYPDMLIEELSKKGLDLKPDWLFVNSDLEKEESNFDNEGFSKN